MNQGMSFRKAVQPIGRGLLFSYPLIKVYQSLPNGMKDDGTRSFFWSRGNWESRKPERVGVYEENLTT